MRPKIIFFLIFVLFLVVFILYGYFQAVPGNNNNQESRPEINIIPDFFDFGEIEYGSIAQKTFIVKNTGRELLEITKIATSCACTSARVGKENLEPGEETELFVEYNTGLMSGSHAKGGQERIIYIKSNDPIDPQAEVFIKAYVK